MTSSSAEREQLKAATEPRDFAREPATGYAVSRRHAMP